MNGTRSVATSEDLLDSLEAFEKEAIVIREVSLPFNGSTRRIDALVLHASGRRVAVEAKVSRADFFRETEEKRAGWMAHVHEFVYLTPPGLLSTADVPEPFGLTYASGSTLDVISVPTFNPSPLEMPSSSLALLSGRLAVAEGRKVRNKARPVRLGNTPMRSFRIDDELYSRAQERCGRDGLSMSEVVRESLRAFLAED